MPRTIGKRVAPGIYWVSKGLYRVRVRARDRTGRRVSAEEQVKGKLEDARARVEALRVELEGRDERGRLDETVADFAERWLVSIKPRVRSSTVDHYATVLDLHLGALGDLPVRSLRRSDVEEWVAEQARGAGRVVDAEGRRAKVSPESVNSRLRVIKAVCARASEDYGIPDPARRVAPLPAAKPDRRRRDGLTKDQARALLEAARADVEWWPLVLTLAVTGARWGEATALQWSDVDEKAGRIWIRRSQRHGVLTGTKTGKERWVPLPRQLALALRAHRRRLMALKPGKRERAGYEQGWCFATAARERDDEGRPVAALRYTTSMAKAIRRWCEVAKITRVVSPHDLRRTFVDLLREAGADAVVEHALVGHASEEMRGHYSTVRDDEASKAVASVVRLVTGKSRRGDPGVTRAGNGRSGSRGGSPKSR